MPNDKNHSKKPDNNRAKDSGLDSNKDNYAPVIATPSYTSNRFGTPLLIAAFILVAALVGILLGTPRPSTNESIMPSAAMAPQIEPAANGHITPNNDTPTKSNAAASMTTPAATAFATEAECKDANNNTPCYMQSCARTDQITCPAGLSEAWRPSTVMGRPEPTPEANPYKDAPDYRAIPPAENPPAPRNDGRIPTSPNPVTP